MIFRGVCTALVTPFEKSNKIDYIATKKLLDIQVKSEVSAILLFGSTGESFSISDDERKTFIAFVKNNIPKHIKLIVGIGSNNTKEIVKNINDVKTLGADACLIHTPYFVKCTQNGIVKFFSDICKNSSLPIIVYNIPSRSGVNILPATMQKLCKIKNIAGLKEANGDINHILSMFNAVGDEFPIYCGNDNLNYLFYSLGASGTISVAANVYPKEIKNLFLGNRSLELSKTFFNFNNLLFCEPNPIPIKYILYKLGIIKNTIRPPLTTLETKHKKSIDIEIEQLKEKL